MRSPRHVGPAEGSGPDRLEGLRNLAWLLDASIPIPGTAWRIGLDPVVGLIPGVGDAIGGIAALYALAVAARVGAPPSVLARIVLNVAIDAGIGAIPLLGDVFDAGWRANTRNLRLLEDLAERPREARRTSRIVVALAALAVLVVVASVGFAVWSLVTWALRAR